MVYKILAVDDEPDVLKLVEMALKVEGYKVIKATNGKEALELANKEKPDAILLDIMMPEMDGMEVFKRLKEKDETSQIPIIMVTGVSDQKSIKKLLDKGVNYYIIKPFDFTDLASKIGIAIKEAEDTI